MIEHRYSEIDGGTYEKQEDDCYCRSSCFCRLELRDEVNVICADDDVGSLEIPEP